MSECFGNFFVLNGKLTSAGFFINSLIYEGESVYEVIKSINGIPVFFGDHMNRLYKSVEIIGRRMLCDKDLIRAAVLALAGAEKHGMINIKIVFNYRQDAGNCLIYYLEPHYPDEEQYKAGVRGLLYHAERKDPVSKVIDISLRSEINRQLVLENCYEALLVNRNGCITECSRTNVFFIRKDCLFTAPDSLILSGITRKQILEVCNEISIPVVFECVRHDEIGRFESAFMTGTSPVILPFNSINGVKFRIGHPIIELLRTRYMLKAEKSISDFLYHPPAS
ncbi:MAG TPA: aminotransferase class IV [Bacteroidales bacterium]|nr:aminotransferase class IV [Bacteroidales bacterium]